MFRKALMSAALIWITAEGALGQDVDLPGMELPEIALPLVEETLWPGAVWETGEVEPAAAEVVNVLLDDVMTRNLNDLMGESRQIVVIHKGRLVAERYRDGYTPDTKLVSWSMAKSITQALVGRAMQEGLIEDIDAPMPGPWPEGDPRAAITWAEWLTMTDGLDYTEIGEADLGENDVVQMMFGTGRFDVVGYVESLPLAHEPGTRWNYSTAGFHTIARALQLEVNASRTEPGLTRVDWMEGHWENQMAKWIEDNLFSPLGMTATPEFDAAGTFLGGSLIYASARDFARFGYLYLQDGVWDGTRLLPEGWVDFARTETPAANSNVYGAGWWITPPEAVERTHTQAALTCPCDAFHAGGNEGQTIWVVPSKELVIVRLGLMPNSPENWRALYEWNQEIARAF